MYELGLSELWWIWSVDLCFVVLLVDRASVWWIRMQTRYMERTNSMRGKRSLEGDEEQQPERKRPALAR